MTRGTRVFDITDFIESHPGGEVILRACGGSIDPYWNIFIIHNSTAVYEIPEQYCIGVVDDQDVNKQGAEVWSSDARLDDPFAQDPVQDEQLIFHSTKPCNAESPGELLIKHFIAPIQLFFVRNHFWVPNIEPEIHSLCIEFSNGEETSLTLQDLKTKFQQHTITATLQCSGNRRSHMSQSAHGKTSGLPRSIGAISTGNFTGVRLCDMLQQAGYGDHADDSDAHVHFSSPSDAYSVSIPLSAALSPQSDVLLAYQMNDEPMTRTHGGPLRVVVPGVTAARSVKWLGRISVNDEESTSQWQRRDYKIFPPHVRNARETTAGDWEALLSIQETPVQSAIFSIEAKDMGKSL